MFFEELAAHWLTAMRARDADVFTFFVHRF